ncbi:MAG: acetylornithine deacetylase, partial [Flavobacteriaceae bacterium]
MKNTLTNKAIKLLKALIETPSFSKEENETALLIQKWLVEFNIK